MERKPFPWALLLIMFVLAYIAFSSEAAWIAVIAGLGACLCGSAAIYQSRGGSSRD